MIELVPMAYRIVNELDAPSSPLPTTATSPTQSRKGDGSLKSGTGGTVAANGTRKMDEDEERDAVFYRLEMLGYRVGQGLVERFVPLPLPRQSLPDCLPINLFFAEADQRYGIGFPKTAPASPTPSTP
jgi:hypothetical protein